MRKHSAGARGWRSCDGVLSGKQVQSSCRPLWILLNVSFFGLFALYGEDDEEARTSVSLVRSGVAYVSRYWEDHADGTLIFGPDKEAFHKAT